MITIDTSTELKEWKKIFGEDAWQPPFLLYTLDNGTKIVFNHAQQCLEIDTYAHSCWVVIREPQNGTSQQFSLENKPHYFGSAAGGYNLIDLKIQTQVRLYSFQCNYISLPGIKAKTKEIPFEMGGFEQLRINE